MTISKAIARAWRDSAYKAKLLSDPHAALAEAGVEVPEGTNIKVVENSSDTHHLVLPTAPANVGELSGEALEKAAAGANSIPGVLGIYSHMDT